MLNQFSKSITNQCLPNKINHEIESSLNGIKNKLSNIKIGNVLISKDQDEKKYLNFKSGVFSHYITNPPFVNNCD